MDKKVSIIVPVYNAEKYLGYTISSIIRQTYKNIEIIFVNDGSEDASLQICNNYAKIDQRIKIIDIPNAGVSAARNRGIEEATGEYIQFADSDDVLHQDMTKRLVESMETYQKDLVICGFQIVKIDEGFTKIEKELFSCKVLGGECVLTRNMFFQNMAFILWKSSLLEEPWNRIYRRRLIEKHQIRFPVHLSLGEDFCFNMEYFKYINGVVFIEKPYYYYLKTGISSLSGCYREDWFENQLFLLQKFEKLLMDDNVVSEDENRWLSEYAVSKMIQSIENLFRKECMMDAAEKKRKIAEIINNAYIRKAFEKADYIQPKYEWIRDKMRFSDVQGIYLWMENNFGNKDDRSENNQAACIVQRSVMNCCFVTCCNLVLKYVSIGWIEALRDSLYQYGIKNTLKRIKEYLLYLERDE